MMGNKWRRASLIYREQGLRELLRRSATFLHRTYVRPLLPRATAVYNNVEVPAARLFDSQVPWEKVERPHYESGIVKGLESQARPGDTVTIVGGGWGVVTIRASQEVGPRGEVTTYEASKKQAEAVHESIEKNETKSEVNVCNEPVGDPVRVWGDETNGEVVDPGTLDACDVLILDCEGSEVEILTQMHMEPRVIIVETHGMYGSSSARIKRILHEDGYRVVGEAVADKALSEFCTTNDVHVITAINTTV